MKKLLSCTAALCLMAAATSAHAARDHVWAAGSSTVFPFASRVAENFARKTGSKAPKVESLGTGGGIKAFCAGVGEKTPDIATASRRMKKSEFDACAAKGVKDIIEIKVGYDGIVVANDKDGADYNFKLEHLYLGLAGQVLRGGKFVKNPSKSWDEVSAGLPGDKILVYGPPPTSGTRDSFVEQAIEAGAAKYPVIAELKSNNEKRFKELVDPLRTDGGWVDAGENDNAIVQMLTKTPGSLGVFGFSFLEENMDKVQGAKVNGVAPTAATIASGQYPLSRSLYIYVKKAHLEQTPGLKAFVAEFVSDAASGKGGYLQQRGLIPLPAGQHAAQQEAAKSAKTMTRPAS